MTRETKLFGHYEIQFIIKTVQQSEIISVNRSNKKSLTIYVLKVKRANSNQRIAAIHFDQEIFI